MKTFKQYNEGINRYLQPKSEEDIEKELEGLSDNEKIFRIILYGLDFNLLPRNKEGICVFDGVLFLSGDNSITKLPDNLWVTKELELRLGRLTELPKGLRVNGDLDLYYNQLTKLSNDLIFGGSLNLSHNKLTEFPENLIVNGSLYCDFNQLTSLPNNLTVEGNLDSYNNQLTSLPDNLTVNGSLFCYNNKVKLELPKDAKISGEFIN